jgi:Domain of unknown function (DUF5666)
MTIMKLSGYFILLSAFGLGTSAHASAVAPSVTGTVQQVSSSTITVNGHTYQVTANTKSDPTVGAPQPGQQVRLFLSNDGSTVTVITPASPTATH